MDINSIFKVGSKVNILIRSDSAQQIGIYTLAQQEPYTFLKDLEISFNYRQESSNATKQGFLLSHADDYPYSITLFDVPFTDKISNLVFKQGKSGEKKTHTMICEADAENTIYFEHMHCYNVFVYHNKELIGYFNETDNYLTGEELIAGEQYTVFYKYEPQDAIIYALDTPNYAYFTLEIFGEGNVNNTSSSVYLKLNQCALLTNKQFAFSNQSGSNTVNLTFNIIKGDKDILIIE